MRHTLFAAVLAVVSMGTAQAAEKIRYEELPNRLAIFGTIVGGFRVKVVTRDGSPHTGRALLLGADYVRVFKDIDSVKQDISSEDIDRIEIRRGRHLFDSSVASGEAVVLMPELFCGLEQPTWKCITFGAIVLSPVEAAFAAFAVASAPVTLAFDGVEFLLPAKVFEILH